MSLREERPRERLRREGARALSQVELLTLVLGPGAAGRPAARLATELVARFPSLDALAGAADGQLLAVPGLGPAKLASLRASVELGARMAQTRLEPGQRLDGPERVVEHFAPRLRRYRQEVFCAVLVDARHRVMGDFEVSRGSLNQSLVHPREVFAPALRESAAALVVLHNHPSGDPTPSREDHEVTRRLARAGEILGIPLLDHIVVADGSWTSFAHCGWLNTVGAVVPSARG